MYLQTACEDQVPCCIIFSIGTPWLNAEVVPPFLNIWNVKVGVICNNKDTFFKCLRSFESVKGMSVESPGTWNNGALSWSGYNASICRTACTGHIGEPCSSGITMLLISCLFWIVFDHLISIVAVFWEKIYHLCIIV